MIRDKDIEKFSEFAKANSDHDLIDLGKLSMKLIPKLLERLRSAEEALSHYNGDDMLLLKLQASDHFQKVESVENKYTCYCHRCEKEVEAIRRLNCYTCDECRIIVDIETVEVSDD